MSDGAAAQRHLAREGRIARDHPDRRIEFFNAQAQGTVACFLGDMAQSADFLVANPARLRRSPEKT